MKNLTKNQNFKNKNKNKNKIKRSRGPDGKIGEINNNRSIPQMINKGRKLAILTKTKTNVDPTYK